MPACRKPMTCRRRSSCAAAGSLHMSTCFMRPNWDRPTCLQDHASRINNLGCVCGSRGRVGRDPAQHATIGITRSAGLAGLHELGGKHRGPTGRQGHRRGGDGHSGELRAFRRAIRRRRGRGAQGQHASRQQDTETSRKEGPSHLPGTCQAARTFGDHRRRHVVLTIAFLPVQGLPPLPHPVRRAVTRRASRRTPRGSRHYARRWPGPDPVLVPDRHAAPGAPRLRQRPPASRPAGGVAPDGRTGPAVH